MAGADTSASEPEPEPEPEPRREDETVAGPAPDDETSPVSIGPGAAWLSDADLVALLAAAGVTGAGTEADQDALLAAEREALESCSTVRLLSSAEIAEHVPAGPGLASLLSISVPGRAPDFELPGIAAGFRQLAAWAQAGELAAIAEIAARSAAANPKIGADDDGRPGSVPPEAAAQVALALAMSQPTAASWVDLAVQLRWRLPATGAALSAGTVDLGRARIIADGTAVLPDEIARAVEERTLPRAAEQTTGQLRGAVARAVIAADPDGAEQRRKDTERRAKVSLYPDAEGTATLTGSSLPGVHAAAAMARISAMARALKASGAQGGLDLLRAHIFLGLLLGTQPLIPPPADGPPDEPPPADGLPDEPPPADGPPDEPPPADGPPDEPAPADWGSDEPPPVDGPAGKPVLPDECVPTDGRASKPPPADWGSDEPPFAGNGRRSDRGDSGIRIGHGSAGNTRTNVPANGSGGWDRPRDRSQPDCPRGNDCRPTRWPDVPPPGDDDAPPDDYGAWPDPPPQFPDPADTGEDDRAELPPPDWPALPARLPAVQPGDDSGVVSGTSPGGDPGSDVSSASSVSSRPPVGLLEVLVPWSALAGLTAEPGRLSRIGPITSLQTRQLLVLAAQSPGTQWRVVITDDDGHALDLERSQPGWHLYSCHDQAGATRATPGTSRRKAAAAGTAPGFTGVVGRVVISIRRSWLGTPRAAAPDAPWPVSEIAAMVLRAACRAAARSPTDMPAPSESTRMSVGHRGSVAEAERGSAAEAERGNVAEAERGRTAETSLGTASTASCLHLAASSAYRPPPRVRGYVAARDVTCRFPPCGQPAWRTDLDHTIPWHRGGPTCSCNLGGCCRTHHKIKQLPGWTLQQPRPGHFQWTTPAGRSYQTSPDFYPA